jgi:speckle-type POZ protein
VRLFLSFQRIQETSRTSESKLRRKACGSATLLDNPARQHLLVAADRYAVDRMKLVCASILCKNLDVETVSATLALAYQHNCDKFKDVCLEFITSSSDLMDSVVATQGYQSLKATCPSALVDAFEKSSKRFRKT